MPKLTKSMVDGIRPPQKGQSEHPDELVRGLRLRVSTGGTKSWIVRARVRGKAVNKTLGRYPLLSLARARADARSFLLDLAARGTPRMSRTFGELAEHWLEHVSKRKNRSWRNQRRRLELHVLPKWRERKLDEIRKSDVRALIDSIEGVSAPNSVQALLKTLFRYALSRDWIEHSPTEGIERPTRETPRDRVLDMREAARVYQSAGQLGYPGGDFIRLLFLTGQRRSEVASMRWDGLDLEARTWRLSSDQTKASRAQLVPLSEVALEILGRIPRFGPFVFTSDGRSHIQGFSKIKALLDRFLSKDDEQLPPWRLHDIRRTVATHLVRTGTTELVVERVLNHARKGVTATTYALHSYEAEKRCALEQWAAELEHAAQPLAKLS